jgi:hypothetical protein
MKRTMDYEAHDGARFATADECRKHERHIKLSRIIDLTGDEVMAAINLEDLQLADAIEFAGNLITKARRENGNLKRKPKVQSDVAKLPSLQARK